MRLLFLLMLATVVKAGELKPTDEGWISAGSKSAQSARISNTLGCRTRGTDKAWVTYLKFNLKDVSQQTHFGNLILTFSEPDRGGQFTVYGMTGAAWDSSMLNASDAPGWDPSANDIGPEADQLSVQLIKQKTEQLVFPIDTTFEKFLKENAGKEVTLIIVKKGSSTSTFVSNRGDASNGPRLEWTP